MTRKFNNADTDRYTMLSGKTVRRFETQIPNERDQKKNTDFKLQFFDQKSVVPILVTGGSDTAHTRTMNAGGKPYSRTGKPDE